MKKFSYTFAAVTGTISHYTMNHTTKIAAEVF